MIMLAVINCCNDNGTKDDYNKNDDNDNNRGKCDTNSRILVTLVSIKYNW